MKKIIKYCGVCEEHFAERYVFCPHCSTALAACEVNPVEDGFAPVPAPIPISADSGYSVTFVDNRGGKIRQTLMLGAFVMVMGGAILSVIVSIYNSDAFVAELDSSLTSVVYAPTDEVMPVEPEPITEKDRQQGGRGGGGDHDPNPVSKGQYANQSENPQIAPTVDSHRLKNPEIPIEMQTKGVVRKPLTNDPYGDPVSRFDVPSDGPGGPGGQGNSDQRGQGPNKGPGAGPGDGPGIGPGPGGPGGQTKPDDGKPPELNVGPTTAIRIVYKPRAIYTDLARKNQIAGTVTLRVTFMANGTIGSIAVVSGLPDGLTEQAIVAARSIQFEPAKQRGIPQTVTKQVQYTFTLY